MSTSDSHSINHLSELLTPAALKLLSASGNDLIQEAVSYTHLRAHETVLDLVCRLLLETKNQNKYSEQHE